MIGSLSSWPIVNLLKLEEPRLLKSVANSRRWRSRLLFLTIPEESAAVENRLRAGDENEHRPQP